MTSRQLDWQWGEVEASADAIGIALTHRRDGTVLHVRGGRLVRGAGYAAAPRGTRRDLARVGAIVRLRERGRYLVHAAGVVDPTGRAWLLSGDSGSGKSTLAYALARAGWRILGDDGVVIEAGSEVVVARAWRDPLRVCTTLAPAVPEMHGRDASVDPADPRRRAPMVPAYTDRAPVAATVFVHRASGLAMHRMAPVEALAALVRQSPWVILNDRHSARHFGALQRLAGLPAFRLGHTPAELHGIADVLGSASLA